MTHSDVTPDAPPTDQQQTAQPVTEQIEQPTSASGQPAAEMDGSTEEFGGTTETVPNANAGEDAPESGRESQLSHKKEKTEGDAGTRSSNSCQPAASTPVQQGQTGDKPSAPPAATPGPTDLIGAEIIRARLIQRAAEGERDAAMRLQTIRAVIHALYGHGGAACHSMTGAVLKVLAEEARAAAGEGVVGAEGVLLAVDDARKASGAAFSEWLTFCRQK